jgi:hypothetical protein
MRYKYISQKEFYGACLGHKIDEIDNNSEHSLSLLLDTGEELYAQGAADSEGDAWLDVAHQGDLSKVITVYEIVKDIPDSSCGWQNTITLSAADHTPVITIVENGLDGGIGYEIMWEVE